MENIPSSHNEPLVVTIDRATRALITRLQSKFIAAGHTITVEQWMLLRFLWKRNGMTQQELVRGMGKTKSTISLLLNQLEKQGFVVRRSDPNDSRQKFIHLTAKGKIQEESLESLNLENIKTSESVVSSDDLEICKKVIEQVYATLSSG